ncbi:MAG: prolyl oligopeptidase family serine peptidase [Terriglobales bacterium]|jgi:dipeptidyl aminopeptidase/acylaminoacyl peptidase
MRIRNLSGLSCFCILSLGCSLFFYSAPSSAQTAPRGFSLEQVLSSPFPNNLVAAEHAGRIAWVFSARGERNVWIADAPNFEARQVTHYAGDDGMPIASLRLTPDGRTVVYARGSEANEAGEIADPTSNVEKRVQQVWAADVGKGDLHSGERGSEERSGEPRLLGEMGCDHEDCEDIQISPNGEFAVWSAKKQIWIAPISGKEKAKALFFARGSNAHAVWSPDGKKIAFVSDRGDHSFIVIYEFGRNTLRYVSPSADRDLYPRWSPDGSQIAFVRLVGREMKEALIPQTPLPWGIWVYDIASDSAREIWKSGSGLDDSLPLLTEERSFKFAAKNRIVFSSEQDGWNHLYSVATSSGPVALLTPGKFETEDVALSADKTSVIYSSNQHDVDPLDIDRRHLWRVGVEGGTPEALTHGATMEWTPLEVAGKVVCLGSSATTPAMPYVVYAQGREMIAKSALPADFPSALLVTPKQVIFKAADGWEIHGQLFEPKFEPKTEPKSGPRPALIFIHGGSERQMMLGFHYMGYYHNAYAMNQYLASRGYVVLSVNYRTGIMYGRHFFAPPDGGPRGGAEYKDIVAAGKYLQSLPGVDSKRIGLWGGSYGGYLTAMGLAHDSDTFAAGVDFHGVHDWSAFTENYPEDASDRDAALKLAFQSSPNAAIAGWRSPVLLIQGDDDRDVDFSQTVDLLQRLRAQKVHVEELIFPDEMHGFLLWKNWIRAYGATEEFFGRELGAK